MVSCAHRDGKLLEEKVAKDIADLVGYYDEEEEYGGEDATATTLAASGRLPGESYAPDARVEEWVADEKDKAKDDEWLTILPFTSFCFICFCRLNFWLFQDDILPMG